MKNNTTGVAYVYDLTSANASELKPKFQIECSKAQEISIKASPNGSVILLWSQNYVDSSGKSYYGEHALQYVQVIGGKARSFVPVFDAMIHDVQWTPTSDYFIVISGS